MSSSASWKVDRVALRSCTVSVSGTARVRSSGQSPGISIQYLCRAIGDIANFLGKPHVQSWRRQYELHVLVSIREDDSAKSVKDDACSMCRFVVVGVRVVGVGVEWREK